jgi:multidrug efflux pump subunit AcrB
VDVHVHQVNDAPELRVNVDRTKASLLGMTQRDVSSNLLISLSSSGQVAPNQWLNFGNGVNYQVAVQTPIYRFRSLDDLLRTPINVASSTAATTTADDPSGVATALLNSTGASPNKNSAAYGNPGSAPAKAQLLSNLATVERGRTSIIVNHYNVQPVFDVYANVDRRDLGGVATDVEEIMKRAEAKLPKSATLVLRGQALTMKNSFFRLGLGILGAISLVYLLMVVNFQSWIDPFIILMALPGALAGIIWGLFLTQTTFSVPSLMGAIMCIGVATANSILMVVFANDEQIAGLGSRQAALSAGYTRIRPVVMTALAMIIGMLPMSLGLGEGGEQNAPLGRAVIGGLSFATLTTLLIVPLVYSLLRKKAPVDFDRQIFMEEHEGELPETASL